MFQQLVLEQLILGRCENAKNYCFYFKDGSDIVDVLPPVVYEDGMLSGGTRMVGCHRERRCSKEEGYVRAVYNLKHHVGEFLGKS